MISQSVVKEDFEILYKVWPRSVESYRCDSNKDSRLYKKKTHPPGRDSTFVDHISARRQFQCLGETFESVPSLTSQQRTIKYQFFFVRLCLYIYRPCLLKNVLAFFRIWKGIIISKLPPFLRVVIS